MFDIFREWIFHYPSKGMGRLPWCFFRWKLGVTQSRPLLETQSSWPFKSNLRLRRYGPQTYIGCSVFSPPKNRKNKKNSHPKTEFCCTFQYALSRDNESLYSFSKVPSILYFHPVHGFRRSVEGSKYPNLGWRKLWPGWHGNISRWLVHGGVAITNYRLSTGFCCEYPFNCSW